MAFRFTYCAHNPHEATAMVVDLRNFTPHLAASSQSDEKTHQFCDFIARVHTLCMHASTVAISPSLPGQQPPHMASTGDGMLIVFSGEQHYLSAFTAAVLLHHQLSSCCVDYNAAMTSPGLPPIGFGIGVESGMVTPIHAGLKNKEEGPLVETVLGSCINIASRAQDITKSLAASRTIFAGSLVEQLTKFLWKVDYRKLKAATSNGTHHYEDKMEKETEMAELNRHLCIKYLHLHHLKGVNHPVDLYRLSESSLNLENPDFQALLRHLASNDAHLDAIMDCLRTDETDENAD